MRYDIKKSTPRWRVLCAGSAAIVASCLAGGNAFAAPREAINVSAPEFTGVANLGFGASLLGFAIIVTLAIRIRKEVVLRRRGEYGWNANYRPDLLVTSDSAGASGPDAVPLKRLPNKRLYGTLTGRRMLVLGVATALVVLGSYSGALEYFIGRSIENGHVDFTKRNYTGAEREYRRAIKLQPSNGQTHLLLAETLIRQNKVDAAIPELLIATTSEKPDPKGFLFLGDCLQIVRRLDDSEEAYRQAIAINPTNADSYLKLSMCLEKLNRKEDAVRELRRVVRIDPKNVRAHSDLGRLLIALGFEEEGLAHLEQASALVPEDISAHHALANAYVDAGRYSDAADEFRAAIRLDHEYARDYYNLAVVLKQLNDVVGARENFNIYVKLSTHEYDPSKIVLTNQDKAINRVRNQMKEPAAPKGLQLPQMISVKQAMKELKDLEPIN